MRNRKLRGTGTKSNAIRCTPKIGMMSRYARSLTGAKIATVSKLDFNWCCSSLNSNRTLTPIPAVPKTSGSSLAV
jgi:hypothetical protein